MEAPESLSKSVVRLWPYPVVFDCTEGQGFAIRALLGETTASDVGAFCSRLLFRASLVGIFKLPKWLKYTPTDHTPEGPHEGSIVWVVSLLWFTPPFDEFRAFGSYCPLDFGISERGGHSIRCPMCSQTEKSDKPGGSPTSARISLPSAFVTTYFFFSQPFGGHRGRFRDRATLSGRIPRIFLLMTPDVE
jgi:hypothetical protein